MTLLSLCAELTALLPLWDAWCADDGRLAAALQTVQRYAADPTPAHSQALAAAQTQVQAAHDMAYAAYAGGPDFDARAWVAMDVTNAFWCVLAALTGAPWPVTLAEAQVACRHVLERAQSLRA